MVLEDLIMDSLKPDTSSGSEKREGWGMLTFLMTLLVVGVGGGGMLGYLDAGSDAIFHCAICGLGITGPMLPFAFVTIALFELVRLFIGKREPEGASRSVARLRLSAFMHLIMSGLFLASYIFVFREMMLVIEIACFADNAITVGQVHSRLKNKEAAVDFDSRRASTGLILARPRIWLHSQALKDQSKLTILLIDNATGDSEKKLMKTLMERRRTALLESGFKKTVQGLGISNDMPGAGIDICLATSLVEIRSSSEGTLVVKHIPEVREWMKKQEAGMNRDEHSGKTN
jgi:hypothetical protein